MARKNRGRVFAGTYHVWRRTTGPIPMFRDDFDRQAFCTRLVTSMLRHGWTCHAFVLMPTHFHLVVSVLDDAMQPGMRDAFGPYAQEFNRRWARSGHLKAAPYKLRPVWGDFDLHNLVRYVARNPVRDGLCEHPQDWRWSSYPGSAAYAPPFRFVDDAIVMGSLDESPVRAIQLLRLLVEPL
jgi:REP element-mobilizing transposase RayT